MISKDEAIAQFRAILGGFTSWAVLAKSQFVEFLSIFASWALRDALWKIERTKQEFFLSTALNDSSIRAHAEDREYVPRKAVASTGMARIANNGPAAVVLPDNTAFTSPAQLNYMLESSVSIGAGAYADVDLPQLSFASLSPYTVTEETAFLEILFPLDVSTKLVRFQVFVDQGDGFHEWSYERLFQNCLADAHAYDEFFSHSGQTGIRFGNGVFGQVPPLGSTIQVDYWTTEGDTTLIAGQELQLSETLTDVEGNDVDLSVVTQEAISGGGMGETLAETRKNLHYWQQYNDKLVWADDYSFFIKRQGLGVTWIKHWGEQEQETETGFDVQNINKIFVSAYAPDNASISTDILAAFSAVPLLNRKFQWVPPVLSTFTVEVTGAVAKSIDIATAIAGIKGTLDANYGPDTDTRLDTVRLSDLYRLLRETGYFDGAGAYYQITLAGTTEPSQLQEFVYLDLENSTFTLAYP